MGRRPFVSWGSGEEAAPLSRSQGLPWGTCGDWRLLQAGM